MASRPGKDDDMFARSKYTLRFRSSRLEDAFNRSRHQVMCNNIARIATIGSLPILQQFGGMVLYILSDGVFRIQTYIYMISLCVLLAQCITWGILPRLQRFQESVSFTTLERIAVTIGFVFLAHFMELAYHAASLFVDDGVDLLPGSVEYHQKSMAVAALGLDAVVTCWHLALPVRWSVIVVMDVMVVVAFTISAYTLSPLPAGDVEAVVILMFSALVMGTSVGLRSTETKDRILFTTILDERTLRAEAEFRSEMQRDLAERGLAQPRQAGSVATTSTTTFGDLVRRAGGGDFDALGDIVTMGEKEQWVLEGHQVQINDNAVLGAGSFGTVVGGEFCSTPVAVKRCNAERRPGSRELMKSILNELNVLCRIRHPNIVVFCGACFNSSDGGVTYKDFLLVLERVPGVTLRRYIHRLGAWKPDSPHKQHQARVMKGVCRALIYMHSRNPSIVHSDLKPSNIMVESRTNGPFAKLLDFGLSRRNTHHAAISGGTMHYMAPEVFDPHCKPKPSFDIFATGRLLFFVSCGREPKVSTTQTASDTELAMDISREDRTIPLPWLPQTVLLQDLRPVIEMCCATDPDLRPKAKQIYEKLLSYQEGNSFGIEVLESEEAHTPKRVKFDLGSDDAPLRPLEYTDSEKDDSPPRRGAVTESTAASTGATPTRGSGDRQEDEEQGAQPQRSKSSYLDQLARARQQGVGTAAGEPAPSPA
jgi:serine/threonine protein kinase